MLHRRIQVSQFSFIVWIISTDKVNKKLHGWISLTHFDSPASFRAWRRLNSSLFSWQQSSKTRIILQFLNYFTNYNDYLFTECELPEVFVQTKRMKQIIKLSILKYNEQPVFKYKFLKCLWPQIQYYIYCIHSRLYQ